VVQEDGFAYSSQAKKDEAARTLAVTNAIQRE
jgi:hypothetical protein